MRTKFRSGRSLVLILVGCALFSLAAGVGIGLVVGRRAQASTGDPPARHKPAHRAARVETIYSLGEMVVNLADVGSLHYAKVSVALGIEETPSMEKLKEQEPVLRDAVIGVLTRKLFDELHQKNGLSQLKEEILKVTSERLPDVTVAEVYLEAFALQ